MLFKLVNDIHTDTLAEAHLSKFSTTNRGKIKEGLNQEKKMNSLIDGDV
jgi:hypothetical protein